MCQNIQYSNIHPPIHSNSYDKIKLFSVLVGSSRRVQLFTCNLIYIFNSSAMKHYFCSNWSIKLNVSRFRFMYSLPFTYINGMYSMNARSVNNACSHLIPPPPQQHLSRSATGNLSLSSSSRVFPFNFMIQAFSRSKSICLIQSFFACRFFIGRWTIRMKQRELRFSSGLKPA